MFITNSRSYGGIETKTDHKLVKMTMKLKWHLMKPHKSPKNNIDLTDINNEEKQNKYRAEVNE